jgi:integrase
VDEIRQQLLRQAVKLLLCTGARRGEVLSMAWADVDLEEKLWRIPAANTKQGATHVVPLNPLALDVLEGLRGRGNPEERFVFPSPEGSRRPFITNPQRMAQSIRDESGVVFRLHDIRRTVRDNLTRLGVLEHVAEAVIGHVEPSLVRRYSPPDPNKYLVEKRQALERWSRRLGEIVAGATKADRVVSIRGTHG